MCYICSVAGFGSSLQSVGGLAKLCLPAFARVGLPGESAEAGASAHQADKGMNSLSWVCVFLRICFPHELAIEPSDEGFQRAHS